MPEVKSTYNFVPAPSESEVFNPPWADQVSHDVPFKDGESGEITLRITAETPIFIRNGHTQEEAEQARKILENGGAEDKAEEDILDKYLSFSHVQKADREKEYFIPATSIKGMVRNVLEIMTNSRMKQVEDDVFSLRYIDEGKYKTEIKNVKPGFLIKNETGWIIEECRYGRIRTSDLESSLKQLRDMTTTQKYQQFGIANLRQKFQDTGRRLQNGDKLFVKTSTGTIDGAIVFFGDIGGKKYDFVFYDENRVEHEVPQNIINKFKIVDAKYAKEAALNPDGAPQIETPFNFFIKNRINKIPVFFNSKNNTVRHFGFSKMYKIVAEKSIHQIQGFDRFSNGQLKRKYKKDLAETIFGLANQHRESIKGRVFISNAFSKNAISSNTVMVKTLGSPKASYFPFYLEQDKGARDKIETSPDYKGRPKGNYKSYFNPENGLRGFKRYPVHRRADLSIEEFSKITSAFFPLKEDTTFNCKIRFHNLKEAEIGALLSAITFHGNEEGHFHNIGLGKPLGFGKVKLELNEISIEGNNNLRKLKAKYLASFEKLMIEKVNKYWLKSKPLVELFATASIPKSDEHLKYPKIEDDSDVNEFRDYILNHQYLQDYSDINDNYTPISSQLELEEKILQQEKKIAIKQRNKELEKIEIEKKQQEKERIIKNQELKAIAKEQDLNLSGETFSQIKSQLNAHFKKYKIKKEPDKLLAKKQQDELVAVLKNIPRDWIFKKGEVHLPFKKFPWTDLTKWLGPNRAKALYKEITGKEP